MQGKTEDLTTGAPGAAPGDRRARVSLEVLGEIVLLAVVGAFFAYLFVASLQWPLGAALMPRIAVIVGTPFWIYRVVSLLRRVEATPAQIMDVGFRLGADSGGEVPRFVRICGYIVALYAAIWLFGFHVALPLGTFVYLLVWGRAGLLWSAALALLFVALIVGLYDSVLRLPWHQPLFFQLLGL